MKTSISDAANKKLINNYFRARSTIRRRNEVANFYLLYIWFGHALFNKFRQLANSQLRVILRSTEMENISNWLNIFRNARIFHTNNI